MNEPIRLRKNDLIFLHLTHKSKFHTPKQHFSYTTKQTYPNLIIYMQNNISDTLGVNKKTSVSNGIVASFVYMEFREILA